jgi:hypothetical protein
MGAWNKGEDGWLAGFDPTAPSHRLQNVEVSISAARGEVMDAMREKADWHGVSALMGAENK